VFPGSTERLQMSVRRKLRVPATVTLLAGVAVALVGGSGRMHMNPPATPIIRDIGTQAGVMHMYPPATPIIRG
jgi:hypothetical protein